MNDLSISEYPVHFKKIIKQGETLFFLLVSAGSSGDNGRLCFPVEIAPHCFQHTQFLRQLMEPLYVLFFMITAVNLPFLSWR